ncbi:MAG: divergent polysaccharide deacetylase family protein [Candidatus Marinimicrobia bacterium]|nr:divergent polysaccharide deacetylase family protein [Candidatus Neomarinimicrobiota bacterium]MBT6870032.1 divergent polysaccharide deacetylase family protein [Candidatus Neomarinimicrobiota bacterium]MBT7376669.1 divergent polysaccharide deacetylase family protein [Candidatus Neomarinimicrobiota bacterium]
MKKCGIIFGFLLFGILISESDTIYKGTICLVIDDFGYAHNETIEGYFSMEKDFSVAIIPGHIYSQSIGEIADSLGFETIIHMPMEPFNYDSLSEKGFILSESLNAKEVEERIDLAFLEIPTAVGMNNHQGSKATANLQLMKNVARSLKKRDKFFLDSFTNPESRGFITMRRFGVKTELRQVFLDHVEDTIHIQNQLDSLVQLSHSMDVAIGIGHVKPITLEILKKEIPRLKSEGYRFVSLSKIVR